MAFQYLNGNAASIAAWFTVFQNWITGLVGWTVESGAWSSDLVLRSLGEDNKYTMLYARVWEIPGNLIRVEARDDAIGTHETNENGRLNAGAGAFDYWMSADKEGFHITFKNATPVWTHLYGGCTLPFALGIDDETYTIIATDDSIIAASILRNYDDVWDVDIGVYYSILCDNISKCPADNSFSLMGIYANRHEQVAGQIPNMSGWINDATIATETEITTQGEGTKETTWIVLEGSGGKKFAQRTGGDKPSGVPEGSFAHETGSAPSAQNFIEVILPAFMTANGWTDLGDPGLHTWGRLFHSTGESGADDIYVLICFETAGVDYFYSYVQDDALGTHRTATAYTQSDVNNFPATYFISGDKDCVCFCVGAWGNDVQRHWVGKLVPANRNLTTSPYHMMAWTELANRRFLLRNHSGVWNRAVLIYSGGEAAHPLEDSSPNDFDGLTYVLLPYLVVFHMGAGRYDFIGQPKYMYEISGCVSPGDTITVADREYKTFIEGTVIWAMRTA